MKVSGLLVKCLENETSLVDIPIDYSDKPFLIEEMGPLLTSP